MSVSTWSKVIMQLIGFFSWNFNNSNNMQKSNLLMAQYVSNLQKERKQKETRQKNTRPKIDQPAVLDTIIICCVLVSDSHSVSPADNLWLADNAGKEWCLRALMSCHGPFPCIDLSDRCYVLHPHVLLSDQHPMDTSRCCLIHRASWLMSASASFSITVLLTAIIVCKFH